MFGYPHLNTSKEAREIRAKHWCPFVNKVCYKQTRLIDYPYFEGRYNLQSLDFHPQHSTVFALYDLKRTKKRFELVASRKISASMDQLFAALRNNPNIPSVERFLEALNRKIEGEAQISLRLGRSTKTPTIDVKPPTSSGKVRESPGEYLKK